MQATWRAELYNVQDMATTLAEPAPIIKRHVEIAGGTGRMMRLLDRRRTNTCIHGESAGVLRLICSEQVQQLVFRCDTM